ncbi:putative basic amino acid antiporter YfcC [Pontixanthobacter aestiaquae]|uniref:Putative basic amino acid antiporter YfcC n=1 Tax=Pontixanthobacter aestiaquae TaxID=1509367 RepID=A0A844Z4Q8_9SPHN|nr:putative basic amino acid antiporter YfcC [Pontixanthobacter aestiaquae]MDN3647271.1 putative basic amino acid antiporter YfcC [Pontixanthobacter aestiaquae]MXO81753.1 putative basic amino acid antiporter YfcC [Pontixanthobacter aestiaquae]
MPDSENPDWTGKQPWRVPDTLLILLSLALLAWLATFVFIPGKFELAGDPARIVGGSFASAPGPMPAPVFGDAERTGLLDFLFAGLVTGDRYSATIGLLAFILILGGVFGMIMKTRAIDAALIASLPDGKASNEWLVVSLFIAFSLGGAVFGMSEEAIALTLVLAPALSRAGYDAITSLVVCYGATQIGFATSWMNPFSVIVAQSIAGLPPMSGMGLRIAIWALFTLAGAVFLWRYARTTRLGNVRNSAASHIVTNSSETVVSFSAAHAAILAVVSAGIGWVAWGVATQGYYLAEIAAQFFAVGLIVAFMAWLAKLPGCNLNALAKAFQDGAAQLLPAALVVAAAKGIVLLLGGDDPAGYSLLNTLLDSAAAITAAAPQWLTAWTMFIAQGVTNLFIVSGSGQASVTMPLMAPLADLSGVERQVAVLAFQLGDGLMNLVVPTSAALMGCLAAARVDYVDWLRFAWKPMLVLMAMASAIMLAAQIGGYS